MRNSFVKTLRQQPVEGLEKPVWSKAVHYNTPTAVNLRCEALAVKREGHPGRP